MGLRSLQGANSGAGTARGGVTRPGAAERESSKKNPERHEQYGNLSANGPRAGEERETCW